MQPRPRARRRLRPLVLTGAVARAVVACRRAVDGGHDLDPGAPASVRLDRRPEHDPVLVQLHLAVVVRPEPGLADVAAALVAEHEHAVVDAGERLPRLLDRRVLDLEQVGEVGRDGDRDLGLNGLGVVVHDGQLLVEAVADDPPADHRHGRVGVFRAGARHEEEAGRERLRVVGRERPERLAVDREQPAREVARVAVEEPVRLARPRIDVAVRTADDEGVALEHADRAAVRRHVDDVRPQLRHRRSSRALESPVGISGSRRPPPLLRSRRCRRP